MDLLMELWYARGSILLNLHTSVARNTLQAAANNTGVREYRAEHLGSRTSDGTFCSIWIAAELFGMVPAKYSNIGEYFYIPWSFPAPFVHSFSVISLIHSINQEQGRKEGSKQLFNMHSEIDGI